MRHATSRRGRTQVLPFVLRSQSIAFGCSLIYERQIYYGNLQHRTLTKMREKKKAVGRELLRRITEAAPGEQTIPPHQALRIIDDYGWKEGRLICMGDEKGKLLDELVDRYHPIQVLELGCYFGYSAIRIASRLPPHGKVTSIEVSEWNAGVATRIIEKVGLSSKIDILLGTAHTILPSLSTTYDMVLVDHDKGAYYEDLLLAEEKMREGTILIADNILKHSNNNNNANSSSMERYLGRVRDGRVYSSSTLYVVPLSYTYPSIPDGIEVSIKR